jgi:FKBP-type peptidyl-prolyl cis-trans isomerase FklB
MKKMTFMAVMAIAAATLVSCGGNMPKANMRNQIDSLSYAAGCTEGENMIGQWQSGQIDLDSAYMSDFIRGLNESYGAIGNKQQEAYIMGIGVGQYLTMQKERVERGLKQFDSTQVVNNANFLAGFLDHFYRNDTTMSADKATEVQKEIWDKLQEIRFAANRETGSNFLAENAKNDSVKTTESGLQYKVIKEGNGPKLANGEQAKIEYEGRLINGTVFDSSSKHGNEPAVFSPDAVVEGFGEALRMMPVGSEWEVYIPQELAYGSKGSYPNIEPYSTIIFKIKMIDTVKGSN